jgi:UDP-N-acetylglucosamine 1-carboxyvinyltransferase
MDKICVVGGKPLCGELYVKNAKNAVLPMLGAVLLCKEPVTIPNCPRLMDVDNMCAILTHLGGECTWDGDALTVCTEGATKYEMPEKIARELRSSIFMLGPVLARFGRAVFSYPGGCDIGNRPIDLHLKGLRALRVEIKEEGGRIYCDGGKMKGANIQLDYPSVGATENLMMAATAAEGVTTINNAAREPEIEALADALNSMGAKITGAGTSVVTIVGKQPLHKGEFKPLPDRIAAGTFLTAAAITGGDVTVKGARAEHLHAVLAKLEECGCRVIVEDDGIRCVGPKRPAELHLVETCPYPGFPTDMQAMFMALCSIADGTSVIFENVFDSRFKIAAELACMGAMITVKGRMAIVRGVERLNGANVNSCDLRAGAALVIAGLRANGVTTVSNAQVIDRGYEAIEKTLAQLGANIIRISGD